MKCASCGTENLEEALFCRYCGSRLAEEPVEAGEQVTCAYCGCNNPVGYRFCNNCGQSPVGICSECGSDNPAGAKFCHKCGSALASSADSEGSLSSLSRIYADCQVGENFFLGSYPYDAEGNERPIAWRVLARSSNKMLVVSEFALDCQKYNEFEGNVTWSVSTLRGWLNQDFLNRAFSREERKCLAMSRLDNPSSPAGQWKLKDGRQSPLVPGGPQTTDSIFCLSFSEVRQYFEKGSSRCCQPTPYAVSRGASVWTEADVKKHGSLEGLGHCWWWLRSPGNGASLAALIGFCGVTHSRAVNYPNNAVRPAMYLALS